MNTMWVMFCINDPDNGVDTERAHAFAFNRHLELEGDEIVVRRLKNNRLRIGRRIFPFEKYKSWVGNWCWDAAEFNMTNSNNIANYLRSTKQYQVTSGIERYWDMWENESKPIDFNRVE